MVVNVVRFDILSSRKCLLPVSSLDLGLALALVLVMEDWVGYYDVATSVQTVGFDVCRCCATSGRRSDRRVCLLLKLFPRLLSSMLMLGTERELSQIKTVKGYDCLPYSPREPKHIDAVA